jgi:hypothetical protein
MQKKNMKQMPSGLLADVIIRDNVAITPAQAAADTITLNYPKSAGLVLAALIPTFNGTVEKDLVPLPANIVENATSTDVKITGFANWYVVGGNNTFGAITIYKTA